MEKGPKMPSPEDMAKIQNKVDEEGKYRLDPTAEQIEEAGQEMEKSLGGEKMEEKKILTSLEYIGEMENKNDSAGIEQEMQKVKDAAREYFVKWYRGKNFAAGLSGDARSERIEQDQEYADSEYLNPVVNFIKEWMNGKVKPVVYGSTSDSMIDVSFDEWFGGAEKRKHFMDTLKNKAEKAEKGALTKLREACQKGGNIAGREKYAAMSDEDIENKAKEMAENNIPSENEINNRLMVEVVRGRTGECSAFTIHDEDGGSHYECGCVVGILKRASSVEGLNSDLESYDPKSKERVVQYFQSVYKDKYDQLEK